MCSDVKSLALALALNLKSLALALALKVKSLALALALRLKSLLTTLVEICCNVPELLSIQQILEKARCHLLAVVRRVTGIINN